MSESKGPPVLDDGATRRPSKKTSGGSKKPAAAPSTGDAPAAAAAAAVAVAGPPTVPRIPLEHAEPKSAAPGDTKPRASKKRTSTAAVDALGAPPSFEAATGTARAAMTGPTSVAPDAAIAVAKAEADAAAAAARREAKKQRARELEQEKRREELARRAEEEQRRLEEQRRRDERQRQQQAALNANAEECQEEAEETNEYEDDDFENYEDDAFEPDEAAAAPKPAVPPLKTMSAKAHAKSRGSAAQVGGGDLTGRELEKIQHALQAESKELLLSTSRPSSSSVPDASRSEPAAPSTGNKSAGRSGSTASSTISSSIAGLKQSLDPRAKRVKEILETRKSLDVDKFQLFQQQPVSEQDKLMQRLRRGAVRQGITQTAEGARAQATQTKPPPSADKSMHFPDDVGLDSASATSLAVRGALAGDNNAEDQAAAAAASLSSSSRFFKFLEHAAYACEALAVENVMAAEKARYDQEEDRSGAGGDDGASQSKESEVDAVQRLFEMTPSTPIGAKLVCPAVSESKEVDSLPMLQQALRERSLAALHFSPVASNLVLACYIDSGDVDVDREADSKTTDSLGATAVDRKVSLRGKTLSCVWDVNQPSRPLHVLKSEGTASSAMLSPTRELFVLTGSTDGSIYVWDLRQNALMSTQGASLLMDGVAVCAPVYSTCGAGVRAADRLGPAHTHQHEHHASSIVCIEPIVRATASSSSAAASSVAGGNFQFGSMDDRGVLIVWSLVELGADDEALVADKCAEIGARVKMVMNARIDTQQMRVAAPPTNQSRRSSNSSFGSRHGTLDADTKASGIVATSAQALSIGPIASVLKFLPHDPNQFVVGTHTGMLLRGHRFERKGAAALASFRAFYRRDASCGGLVRGLGSSVSVSVASLAGVTSIAFHPFESQYFLAGYSDGGVCAWDEAPFGVGVSSIAWSPSRPAVFFAAFDDARVRVWDLLESSTAPIITHALDPPSASPLLTIPLYPLTLSAEHVRTSRPSVAWPSGSSPMGFTVLELSNALAVPAKRERAATAKLLECIL